MGTGACTSGIGGTGKTATGGVGGSGLQTAQTGVGGTGIVGTITGFGSIRVNGIESQYDRDTPVKVDGEAASTDMLRRDQLVAISAHGDGDRLRARMIIVNQAVVGPVTASEPGTGKLEVMGIPVRAKAATHYEPAPGASWRRPGRQ
jgi:hypothetical protein